MRSRYLQQLDRRIAAATGAVESACLHAQRAVYLARQGKREAAAATIAGLREDFRDRPNAELTAWISLAESLIDFYALPGPQAIDRLRRAQALATAIRHPVLVPLCAAWLAHMEFNAGRAQQTVEHATQALRLAQPDHHAALARVSLVVADALHFAGSFELAQPWYAAVREHALVEGDDAMISAMLHNVATFRTNNVRLAAIFGLTASEESKRALMEADSAMNFDAGIGTVSLDLFVPLLRAQLLTVRDQYAQAVKLFNQSLPRADEQGMSRLKPCFYADRAWCNLQLGDSEQALADVQLSLEALDLECDTDDLATTHGRVAAIFHALGDAENAEKHERLSVAFLNDHQAARHVWMEKLQTALAASPQSNCP